MRSHRTRARSWSYNVEVSSPTSSFFSERNKDAAVVVRKGPLLLALTLLLLIPAMLLSISDRTVPPSELYRSDLRPGGAWLPSDNIILSSGKGTTWRNPDFPTTASKVVAVTSTANCEVHTIQNQDHIFLEQPNKVVVVVVGKEGDWLLLEQRQYAIPGSIALVPLSGDYQLVPGSAQQSPFDRALSLVRSELSIYSNSSTAKDSPSKVVLDEFGLVEGSIPKEKSTANRWIFLGRFRTMANHGGGFAYCYLVQIESTLPDVMSAPLSPSIPEDERPTIRTFTTHKVKNMVLLGKFKDLLTMTAGDEVNFSRRHALRAVQASTVHILSPHLHSLSRTKTNKRTVLVSIRLTEHMGETEVRVHHKSGQHVYFTRKSIEKKCPENQFEQFHGILETALEVRIAACTPRSETDMYL